MDLHRRWIAPARVVVQWSPAVGRRSLRALQRQSQRLRAGVGAGRLPNYDQYIRSYRPVDYLHYVRHTRTFKVLCWLANDPPAKFELESQAEGWRLSCSPLPQTPQGGAVSTRQFVDRRHVEAHLGRGVDIGRGDTWGVDALVAWRALAPQMRRNACKEDSLGMVDLWWDASLACDDGLMAAPT